MYKETTLPAPGYHSEPVPNLFYQQEDETATLAVILPGFGYHADLPLLFYPGRIALNNGMDLLRLETAYSRRPEFSRLNDRGQLAWLDADTDAVLNAALARRAYRQLIVIGKSLGTMAMGHLLERHAKLPTSRWVWLTPVLTDLRLVEQVQQQRPLSLFVIGDADQYYNDGLLQILVEATQGRRITIAGGNHILEVPGSVHQTIQALDEVMTGVEDFITN